MGRIVLIVSICAGVTLLAAMVNIWLGILVLPLAYGACEALLFDQ